MGLRNAGQGESVDASAVSDAVISALNTGTSILSRIKASAAEALTDAGIATVSAIITAFDTGTDVLSRIKASAATAITEAVTANSIPSDADVAAVPAATATALNTGSTTLSRVEAAVVAALNTGTSTLSRIVASSSLSIANKVSDNTIPSNADLDAIPSLTMTAANTGSSTLSRVIASVVQAISDAVSANTIPSKTNVTDVPGQTATELNTGSTSLSRVVASCAEALIDANLAPAGFPFCGYVTSAAGVAGPIVLIPDPGDDAYWYEIDEIWISTKTSNLDYEINSPSNDPSCTPTPNTLGTHTLQQDNTVSLTRAGGYLLRFVGEAGDLTMSKTTGAAVAVTFFYRTNNI